MSILLVEDNPLKRAKIREHLHSIDAGEVVEAESYNSGMTAAMRERFDLIILDMSIPTFDRGEGSNGGRFRSVGGRELASRLAKIGRLCPFFVITGYTDFSVNSTSMTIGEIDHSLRLLGESYLGFVHFDVSDSAWKDCISRAVRGERS